MNDFDELNDLFGGNLIKNEPLFKHTTFRIGGRAKYFYEAEDNDDFIDAVTTAKKSGIPYFILGGGSNVLFSDDGFDGLVISRKDTSSTDGMVVDGNIITVDSGVNLGELIRVSVELGLSGLEWAVGIPGTVGGAVRGNAGAYGGQMAEIVESVESLCFVDGGKVVTTMGEDLDFSYRDSIFKKHKECVIISIILRLHSKNKRKIEEKINKIIKKRSISSTPSFPSAGSIFKNPTVGDTKILADFEKDTGNKPKLGKVSAGYLIDKLDLKGKKIGSAVVSDKNANFILNTGKATAENVVTLISFVKQQVRDSYGIQLEEEIELVGF